MSAGSLLFWAVFNWIGVVLAVIYMCMSHKLGYGIFLNGPLALWFSFLLYRSAAEH